MACRTDRVPAVAALRSAADPSLAERGARPPRLVCRRELPAEGLLLEAVSRDFGGHVDGRGAIAAFVVAYHGVPIGYVQGWRGGDFPDYARYFVDDPAQAATTASFDLFVGDIEYVGGGLGPLIIGAFLREIVFGASDATGVVIKPDPGNTGAIRAYEKAGFRHLRTVQPPGRPKPSYLMRIERSTGTE